MITYEEIANYKYLKFNLTVLIEFANLPNYKRKRVGCRRKSSTMPQEQYDDGYGDVDTTNGNGFLITVALVAFVAIGGYLYYKCTEFG